MRRKPISAERRLKLIKASMSKVWMDLEFFEAIKSYAEDCIMDVRMKKPWHDALVEELMKASIFAELSGTYTEEPKCAS